MTPAPARDTTVTDMVIDALLQRSPPPAVYANDERGLIVAMPDSVPVHPQNVIRGQTTVLELLDPADTPHVAAAWYQALGSGVGQTVVHLVGQPDCAVALQLVDARHRYGVLLGFIIGTDAAITGSAGKAPMFRRRLCSIDRDAQGKIVGGVDDAVAEVLGYAPHELLGRFTIDIVHPDDKAAGVANWMAMLARPGSHARTIVRYRHRDGSWHWFESTLTNRLDESDNPRVSTELVDITDRMAAQEALRASEQLHRHLTESLPLGILQIDAQRNIVYRNARLIVTLGQPEAATFASQFSGVAHEDRDALESALIAILTAGDAPDLELSFDLADGRRRCTVGMRALTGENGAISGAILWVADITDPFRLRKELEARATYDALTQCRNRASILASLDGVLQVTNAQSAGTALMFIDLNAFKAINDTLGHEAGDAILRYTGDRLRKAARNGDLVGRLGGDEFLIVFPDVEAAKDALVIAQRVDVALREPIVFGASVLAPSASIGVAWTAGGVASDVLVARADSAMYESKRGRSGPVLAPPVHT